MIRRLAAIAFVLVCGLSLAGCAANGGEPAAKEGFVGSTKLPPGKVGILNILASSETLSRWQGTATKALAAVGWESVVTDGKGDPAVISQAISSFVQQRVDGIIILGGTQVGPLTPQLQAAKDAGIPVIAAGIKSPDPEGLLDAQYEPDGSEYGVLLADYLKKKFEAGTEWVALTITADKGGNAPIAAAQPILEDAGLPLVGTVDLNLTKDLPSQISKGSADLLRAHPNAKVLMSCCDFTAAFSVPALNEAGHPDVIQALRYDNLSILDMIRKGDPVVTVGSNSDTSILLAIDQLLAHKATGAEIDKDAQDGKDKFAVIDAGNVPAKGFYFDPDQQIHKFLTTWKAEYK